MKERFKGTSYIFVLHLLLHTAPHCLITCPLMGELAQMFYVLLTQRIVQLLQNLKTIN